MALANYTDLLASIASMLARADLTALIPDMVTLAEAEIINPPDWRPLRTRQMEGRVTLTAAQYVALPAGFLELRSLKILGNDPELPLELASVDYIQSTWPDAGDLDRPTCYAVDGPQLMLGPRPDVAYTLEADIYTFTGLSVAAPTNWLMTAFPNLYLYKSLEKSALYTRADTRAAVWKQLADDALAGLRSADAWARWPAGSMQARPQGSTP